MTAATARVLDAARDGWTMAGVLAVMIFLAVLATAGGVGTATAGRALRATIEGQVTVQLVSGDAATRARRATQAVAALRRLPGVSRVTPVSRAELTRLLGPWLGSAASDDDLPVPALIDVTVRPSRDMEGNIRRIVAPIDPDVRIDAHGSVLGGARALLETVTLLAAAIVMLMIAAALAMVLLTTRAGLAAHQRSIEVMHRLGATDRQIAALFCRRMARDAALAAAIGAPVAWGVILLLDQVVAGSGAQLLGGMILGRAGWGAAIALPLAFVALAAVVAYLVVHRALGRLT